MTVPMRRILKLKAIKVNTTAVDSNNIGVAALERVSTWKMRYVVEIMLKWKGILHNHE